MGRFAATVPVYAAHRQPYPPAFFAAVAERLRLDGSQRLIDLGCGPGLLALGFAPHVASVTGVDPEPAMLAAARSAAEAAGVDLALIESTTEALPPDFGPFEVVTIGRALHWMAPGPTVQVLDRLVVPGGTVVLCGSHTVAVPETPWVEAYDAARRRWSGDESRYKLDHVTFFAGSRFRVGETVVVRFEHAITVDHLVGRFFSMSTTSRDALGAEADRAADAIRAALAPFAAQGPLREIGEARATLIA